MIKSPIVVIGDFNTNKKLPRNHLIPYKVLGTTYILLKIVGLFLTSSQNDALQGNDPVKSH